MAELDIRKAAKDLKVLVARAKHIAWELKEFLIFSVLFFAWKSTGLSRLNPLYAFQILAFLCGLVSIADPNPRQWLLRGSVFFSMAYLYPKLLLLLTSETEPNWCSYIYSVLIRMFADKLAEFFPKLLLLLLGLCFYIVSFLICRFTEKMGNSVMIQNNVRADGELFGEGFTVIMLIVLVTFQPPFLVNFPVIACCCCLASLLATHLRLRLRS